MSKRSIRIDLDTVTDIALRGVRRASVFIGLGVNAANDPKHIDYALPGSFQIRLVPDNLPQEKITEFKEEFARWVVANGLRELIETFSVFLVEIHKVLLLLDKASRGASTQPDQKRIQDFGAKSASNQLRTLREEFSISTDYESIIDSVRRARNCFTHRLGIVRLADCNAKESLQLKWRGMEIFAQFPDGTEQVLPKHGQDSIQFDQPATICLRYTERTREFRLGHVIRLEPHELAEICWTFAEAARGIGQSIIEIAKSRGMLAEKSGS